MTKTIYLLPNLLDPNSEDSSFFPAALFSIVPKLSGLIAESEKSARRFLKFFGDHDLISQTPIRILCEHTTEAELAELFTNIKEDTEWGLISDAGLPCIADPGASLVRLARSRSFRIIALPGPSSLMMALQLSGMNGQRFVFHGYLPRQIPDLEKAIHQLERFSIEMKATQIVIEAPYRSQKLFDILLQTLSNDTLLCIAAALTTKEEFVETHSVFQWKKQAAVLSKEPTVFLISANFY